MLIPKVELVAALQQSYDQAVRDGLPRCAAQVQGYIDEVQALPHGILIVTVK